MLLSVQDRRRRMEIQVSVEYGLYYNREKTDDNGTYCDEYVLEKNIRWNIRYTVS